MSEHRTSFHFKRFVDTIIMGNGKIMKMRATVMVTRHTVLTELSRFSTRAFLRLSMLNCFTSCSASAIRRSSLFLYHVQERDKFSDFLSLLYQVLIISFTLVPKFIKATHVLEKKDNIYNNIVLLIFIFFLYIFPNDKDFFSAVCKSNKTTTLL